jgi:hypothetical protein
MHKKDIQAYMDRWKFVNKIEEREMRNASFDFLLRRLLPSGVLVEHCSSLTSINH